MPLSEILFIIVFVLITLVFFYLNIRRKIALVRSVDMVFLRVIIARKDSDLDEKKETVKDFREQISIMEQLLASMKAMYSSTLK
jgi:hypothetical protein